MPRYIAVILVLGAFLALSRPAAADSGTLTLAESPNYTGPCPVMLHFSGSITGPAQSAVTYHFGRYVGAWSYTSDVSATIPAGGALPVTSQLVVDQAHSGFQSYELQLVVPNTGNDLTKAKIYFTVNCSPITTSTPVPWKFRPGASAGNVYSLTKIPFPTGLRSTKSATDCSNYGGFAALFCPQALHDGYLVMIWDWEGDSLHPKIDGYRTYRVDGGQHSLVDHQSNPQTKITFIKPPAEGFGGKCYAVTAYAGSEESPTSASYCVGARYVSRQGKTLHMAHWAYHYGQYVSCGFTAGICVQGVRCDDMCLGWNHYKDGSGPGLIHVNTWWRSYVEFDPRQIYGLNVFKASLSLRVVGGDPNCFGQIGPADAQAWDTQNTPNAAWQSEPHVLSSTGAVFDVTDIVRDWARGATNWGFAFRSTNEDTGAEDTGGCMLHFDPNATLSIEFY